MIEEPGVDVLGEGVARVQRLLNVQRHVDALRLAAPLGLELAGGQLVRQLLRRDAKQEGREVEICGRMRCKRVSIYTYFDETCQIV